MLQYISRLSGYFLLLFILLYTLLCFWAFVYKQEENYKAIYIFQNLLMFGVQLVCFYNLALESRQKKYVLFYLFVQVFLLACLVLVQIIYKNCNKLLLNNMCMLLGIGLFMIARLSPDKARKQYIIVLIALAASLLIPLIIIRVKSIKKGTWLYATIGITALSAVLILGEVTRGSKLTFNIGDITFQPSEFIKILFVFFIAGCLYEGATFKRVFICAVISGIHIIILALSTDLGSALIYFVAFLFMVLLASHNYWYLLAGVLGGSGAAIVAYHFFEHVRIRVLAWQDPWSYIDDQGYQITQSLFAIGSGRWLGMGILEGNPKSIPYVEADFIFSSICEELGVVFGICILLICISSFIMMMQIAMKLQDVFYRLIVFGIGIINIFQIFLTVGGGVKFIPLTGVTLPFISYGGSSVMASIMMFFVVHGVYIVSQKQSNNEKVNKRDIIVVSSIFVSLFLCMIGYICHFVATNKEEMINNSYNSRQQLLISRNYRGTIYSADREILAITILDEEENEKRYYPYRNLFSHIVGYSTKGRMGVEALANYYLIQSNTSIGNKVSNDIAGIKNPGDNVYTTLDVDIQKIADEELSIYKGAIIVTEVSTGKILAMVSNPDFDPNEITELWDDLVADKKSTVLVNRATQGLYPPGSTFKIITALEYIRENPDNFDEYSYQCNGSYKLGDNKIRCYHGANHGKIDFTKSFAKSCNSSFVNIGMTLDRTEFSKTLKELLFNSELPLKLNYSSSNVMIPNETDDSAMMQTVIGQGKTQISPIHLNMITSAVANNGVLMTPYVIDRVENDEGKTIKSFKPEIYGRMMSEEEAVILQEMMSAVVETGTAKKLSGLSFTAAGKTGSAEYSSTTEDSHAWFTGFAPAENPEVCVTIIIESAGSGGDYAVPIAKRIFQSYFDQK